MERNCPSCGAACSETDVICPACGKLLMEQQVPPAYYAPPNGVSAGNVPPYGTSPYGAPPYAVPPYAAPWAPVPVKTNGKAVASMVLGIVSVMMFFFSLFTGVPSVILGFFALSDIRKSGGRETGSGMAIAGIICSFVGILIVVLYFVFLIIMIPLLAQNTGNTYPS